MYLTLRFGVFDQEERIMAESAVKTTETQVIKAPPTAPAAWHPLDSLRREIDKLFEDFGLRSLRAPLGRNSVDPEPFWRGEIMFAKVPAVDFVDDDKAYVVSAELPGMAESDVEVKFSDGTLTIRGEKKEEKEERKKDYYLSERRYGSFQRAFQVPHGVDAEKIEARFANGVLTVRLPKAPETAKNEKKIEIKKG
jgi:HSP20 family protein